MAYRLPIKLKVSRVRVTPTGVEVDGVVEDAAGENVRSFSLTMPPDAGYAGAVASLQAHADQIAKGMHAAKLAVHAEPAAAEAKELELATLVDRVFEGSVAQ